MSIGRRPSRSAPTSPIGMSLRPLLDAAPVIQVHAFAAMAAFAIGIVQLAAPKGTLPHRTIGWFWVGLMTLVAASSFWIHGFHIIGSSNPLHFLSIFSLAVLPRAGPASGPPHG